MDYYVYALIDPRDNIPRYIGKGKEERIKESKRPQRKSNKYKDCWLRALERLNLKPVVLKVIEGLTEAQAFAWECGLIGTIGRFDLKTGPLFNRTGGGDGVSGYKYTDEQRARHSKIVKETWTNPETRAHRLKGMKEANTDPKICADPELCAYRSEKMKEVWTNSEYRAHQSQIKRYKPPREGYKGVSFYKRARKWMACITVNGKSKHLGLFSTPEEAAKAYNAAVDEYWGGDGYKNPV